MKTVFNLLFLILTSLFIIPQHASASTILYFGSVEKTFDDLGNVTEEKVYYPAGGTTVQITKNMEHGTKTSNYLHSDHIGSTVLVTDSEGNETASYLYYPYGQQFNTSTSLSTSNLAIQQPALPAGRFSNDKLYTGQRKDTSTDLYYYNARYYNPKIGHFISADKAEGPNRYAYVGNNPVGRNDPSGNNWIDSINQWWNNVSASFDNNEIFGHYSETQINTGKFYASKDYQNMVIGGYAAAGVLYGGVAGAAFAPEIAAAGLSTYITAQQFLNKPNMQLANAGVQLTNVTGMAACGSGIQAGCVAAVATQPFALAGAFADPGFTPRKQQTRTSPSVNVPNTQAAQQEFSETITAMGFPKPEITKDAINIHGPGVSFLASPATNDLPPSIVAIGVNPRGQGKGPAIVSAWEKYQNSLGYDIVSVGPVANQKFWGKMGYALNPYSKFQNHPDYSSGRFWEKVIN